MPGGARVPDFIEQHPEYAKCLLKTYFGLHAGRAAFTGAHFERLAGGGDRVETRDILTPDDLVAITMLSVRTSPWGTLELLGLKKAAISELLCAIPVDCDLVDAGEEHIGVLSPAWHLWGLLVGVDSIGPVIAGKLLARKRPKLIPILDSVVRSELSIRSGFWSWLASSLREERGRLHNRLIALREDSGIGSDISPIRVFDILVWMSGTGYGHTAAENTARAWSCPSCSASRPQN